jgi:hypothetical protein
MIILYVYRIHIGYSIYRIWQANFLFYMYILIKKEVSLPHPVYIRATLGPGVHSASNRNEVQKQKLRNL